MRRTGFLLLACALLALSLTQASTAQQTSPDVVVYSFEWHARYKSERRNDYGLEKRGDYARTDPLNPEPRSPVRSVPSYDQQRLELPSPAIRPSIKIFNGYESSLQLKNTGTKTVTAVHWEHIFFTDESKQKELKRFRFTKETSLKPGEQKILVQRVQPESHAQLPARPAQSVSIERIEYSDGSVWQRP